MTECKTCKFYHICKGRLNETVSECARYKSVEQTNEGWFATLSTRKKAEFLSGMCVAAVRDFEWSETKRCCIDYWERWLKEAHK